MIHRGNLLIVQKGTNANTIKACFLVDDGSGNHYTWNGIPIGTYANPIDNIAKGATTGAFWYSADGSYMVIEIGKNVEGIMSGSFFGNNYPVASNPLWNPMYCFPNITADHKIRVDFIQNNGGVPDLTLLSGNQELDVLIHYVTSD